MKPKIKMAYEIKSEVDRITGDFLIGIQSYDESEKEITKKYIPYDEFMQWYEEYWNNGNPLSPAELRYFLEGKEEKEDE